MASAVKYDPNKDYSTELQRTDLSAEQRTQLEAERQAKIDDMYGGNEPNMAGTTQKFSDVYKSSAANTTASGGGSTAPAGFTGSANSVGTYTDDQQAIVDRMNANSIKWHTADQATKSLLEAQNQEYAKQLGDSVTFDPVSGYWSGVANKPVVTTDRATVSTGAAASPERVDPADLQSLLDQWKSAALTQSETKVDYSVQQAVLDLERALEDSKAQFKEQQESVTRDEMQARDNSALYSEARGDKGGIGEEQYSSIMNTAAQNRLLVQQEQTKLSTDTARQIADLRAQGEFEKADALLEISQTYLSQLMNLEQWAAEYNLSVDQFNETVRQWEAEFQFAIQQYQDSQDLAMAELTGQFADGTTTLQAQNIITQQLASSGESLLAYGILPSDEQLAAMGMTKAQAQQLITAAQLQAAAKSTGGGSDPGDGSGITGLSYDDMWYEAWDSGSPSTWLKQKGNYQKYGLTSAPDIDDYNEWYRANKAALDDGTYGQSTEVEDYGSEYTSAVATARLMRADGKSFAEIDEFLSKFDLEELTDAGLVSIANILNFGGEAFYPFVETERPGVVSG